MKTAAHRVSRLVSQKVWAIRESTLDVMVEILRMRAAGIELSQDEVRARIGAGPQRPVSARNGAIGVLNLHGVIAPRMNMMTEISGGVSLDVWLQGFRAFRDDSEIGAIVIDGDTPGGDVRGLIEASEEIYRAREIKPVVGVVRHMVASAGLWLFSGCSEIVCTPSGEAGALGCYMVHEDWSKANEMMGVKPTYISYGRYKTEGNFDEPLGDEALAFAQSQVDRIGLKFEKTVAKYRDVPLAKVQKEFGQGRMLMAEDARSVGMVDRIATFEDTIARLAGTRRRSQVGASTVVPVVVAEEDEPVAGALEQPEVTTAAPGATVQATDGLGNTRTGTTSAGGNAQTIQVTMPSTGSSGAVSSTTATSADPAEAPAPAKQSHADEHTTFERDRDELQLARAR